MPTLLGKHRSASKLWDFGVDLFDKILGLLAVQTLVKKERVFTGQNIFNGPYLKCSIRFSTQPHNVERLLQ